MESTRQDDPPESDEGDDRKPPAKETGDDIKKEGEDDASLSPTSPPASPSSSRSLTQTRKRKGKSEKSNHQMRWDEMYGRLCEYHKRFGNANVPNRYAEDPQLGSWVSAQRRAYKTITSGAIGSTAMTLERATKLKQLGFEWEALNPNNVPWETRYNELLAFVKKYGHANVPMRWKENVQLSNWVSKQRHDYKLLQRGTSPRLTEKRKKLLDDVNFIWEVERGSSIAQLQRVSVVGLPTRKRRKDDKASSATVDVNISASNTQTGSFPTQQQPQAQDIKEEQAAASLAMVGGSNTASALASEAGDSGVATGGGSEVAAPAAIGQALSVPPPGNSQLGAFPLLPLSTDNNTGIVISDRTSQQSDSHPGTGDAPATSAQEDSTSLGQFPPLQLIQGGGSNASPALNLDVVQGTAPAPLTLNLPPLILNDPANSSQGRMVILPIVALLPQQSQGTVATAAPSLINPQVLPLISALQGINNHTAQTSNALSALAPLLGGNAALNATVTLASLLGGGSPNTAGLLGNVGVAAPSPPVPLPAPPVAGNLANLAALTSALGHPPQLQVPAADSPSSMATATALAAVAAPSAPLPAVGVNQNQANLATLSALLNSAAAATTPSQSLTASNLASLLAGAPSPVSVPSAPFAPAQAAPPQIDAASTLASTLSRFLDTSTATAPPPQPPPPPAAAPPDAAQNLASALSQFFQSQSQNTSRANSTQQARHRRNNPDSLDEPQEKRSRTS